MALIDLEAFERAACAREPFMHMVMPDFLRAETAASVSADFPRIEWPGLLPLDATRYGPAFGAMIAELTSAATARAFGAKFGLELEGQPTMVTVRGRCQEKDGRIHTDSNAKLVTALLYFNAAWEEEGGRLRLLRGPDDLQDCIAEVAPRLGTLVAFRRSDNSYHGHAPFVGARRYVMINWMASGFAAQRELLRHRLSATAKRALHHA